jgi:hypothetical protein
VLNLSGYGFTATDNIIHFGDGYAVNKAKSPAGETISFKVPSIPKGIYDVYVENARGVSNKDTFFVVTDGVTPEPKIESISADKASSGETVSIKGSGFTTTGNRLQTSVKVFRDIPSPDGKTISFVVPTDLFKSTEVNTAGIKIDAFTSTTTPTFDVPAGATQQSSSTYNQKIPLPVWVYAVNENGVSNGVSFIFSY